MRFLIDEDVPNAITTFLRDRGHEVHLVVDVLGPMTPDPAVARFADLNELVVVTFNLRDYNRLVSRAPRVGHDRHPRAGLLGFQCHQAQGLERLAALVEIIEHEHQLLVRQQGGDRRLIVQISATILKILR